MREPGGGLLIVNADDWGQDAATTDAIAACFLDARLTSATAMVHMADSERAAALAQAIGLPVGLHLNLSEPFTSATVAGAVRGRQARLAPRFDDRRRRLRRWVPDPRLQGAVDACVRDQLEAFVQLYGRHPTHVDGHKHVQVSPTVARAPSLAAYPLRRAVDDDPGAHGVTVRARRLRHRLTLERPGITDHFFAISHMGHELRAGRVPEALALTRAASVEVMVHPGEPAELALLETDAWAEALRGQPLGTYADLLRR